MESAASRALRGVGIVLWAVLTAAPWLDPHLVWCGWLSVAVGLGVAGALPGRRRFFLLSAWSAISIAIAFHWSPAVLAYTMGSSYGWGVAVFAPLVIWDAARLLAPFWLGGLLAGSPAAVWFTAGCSAVILEAVVPSVFPWRFGCLQVAWPWTLQAVDLFGPGWSTLMVFAHAGFILLLARAWGEALRAGSFALIPRRVCGSPVAWLCLANLLYSFGAMAYWRREIASSPSLRLALAQADPSYLESTSTLRRLTRGVARRVDLVCWPESSGGTYEASLSRLADPERVFQYSRDPNRGLRPWERPDCELLLGGKTYHGDREHPSEIHQTALLIDRQEKIVGRYHKRRLMPFGEYVPGAGWIPGLDQLFSVEDVILPGSEATVLSTETGARLGVLLCYEDMQPDAARSLARNSANVLISLINASAFESRFTLSQHRMLAQLRAVECRRYLARASATGETCVISPLGTIEAALPMHSEDVLLARVALLERQSWYCSIYPLAPALCCAGLGLWAWRLRSQRTNP